MEPQTLNDSSWHTSNRFGTPSQQLLNFIITTWELNWWFINQ